MKRIFLLLAALLLLLGCGRVSASTLSAEATAAPSHIASWSAPPRTFAVAAGTAAPTITPPPTPSPTPTPTPTPVPTPTPEPTPDPDRPMIALTFDDGPTEYTPQVLDLLERHGAKGTFFVIGQNLSEGTRPVLQRMADMGCNIGMHDLTHTDLTKLSAAANVKRIREMQALVSAQIDGGYETHLLRPPFGSLNKTVRRALRTAGAASIRWSVDTRDWSNKNPKTILKIVKAETRDGAILLFHDRLPTTVAALEEAIPWLQEQGYDLVTVTELIESSGQSIRYGEDYQRKPGR